MIEIKNDRIYFFNNLKPELQVRDFHCLSGFTCPVCKNVLAAIFVGDILPETIKEYLENDNLKYGYDTGSSSGGQWLTLQLHVHKRLCHWEVVGSLIRGVEHAVDAFLHIHDARIQGKQALIERIKAGTMPGFKVVEDYVHNDEPMLLFREGDLINAAVEMPGADRVRFGMGSPGKIIDFLLGFSPEASPEEEIEKPPEPEQDLKDNQNDNPTDSIFGEVISSYSRAQAIEDGQLIDITDSELTKNAGIKYPIAITSTIWGQYIEVPEGLEHIQDLNGRLWDVLWMFSLAAKASKGEDIIHFKVIFLMMSKSKPEKPVQKTITLKAICGPGDNAEPVITIMGETED